MTTLITGLDYPDPDVIRVGDTYFMVSTTMHFFPGGQILRSNDLINWEHQSYVFEALEDNPAHRLDDGLGIYGKGMWAASLRYHQGIFYMFFSANDTRKTTLFRATTINGPWRRSEISGFYHDPSLLFDGDRVFLAWGNTEIRITELDTELSGPLEGGLDRVVLRETGNQFLGYEGSHLYCIHGRYYLFLIHSLPQQWRRVQACFWADSLEGEFQGGDVFNEDLGYGNQGIAQGGLVDSPDGQWYAVLFQDRGAVGRIPVVIDVSWNGPQPIFGSMERSGTVPQPADIQPGRGLDSLVGSDDFRGPLAPFWQWNHNPDASNWRLDPARGQLRLRSGRTAESVLSARNTLTQRMIFPRCSAELTIDGYDLKPGDTAGLLALQGAWAAAGLRRSATGHELVMINRVRGDSNTRGSVCLSQACEPQVRLRLEAFFSAEQDFVRFSVQHQEQWLPLGPKHQVFFQLDHFVGCRFGLFLWSSESSGGEAGFSNFVYETPVESTLRFTSSLR